ncbi:MAG: molybdopterin molybdotransferase MoeA [Gammaproteobacteria bacterium]|nr:molybdopterin molybdotransferase MoeA [Rhodocyclaceae bacterium]MBU3908569.1 molybdopterin molybdotransferase MoeA [Gammaproteobacteria bacterium]MBU3990484.1 molybdopterin molybdotransferase MoeA [Gammaproteobacteria bacterium]MBU4004597.1 molybdopterin molybdotransferase MoeA [Gammaproteobacteria bacterium]MBU4021200.1 molybdopterin molybdotransferase MoeA [Gammaproteobacteria bacterium]
MTSLLKTFSCTDDYDPDSLPVERARQLILDTLQPVAGHERLPVHQALDRVLVEDVIAPFNVPAHDNSAMDGWAVRHADLAVSGETRLKNIGTAFAGRPCTAKVGAGETARIMTGAALPEGVDSVVVQEVVRVDGDAVIIPPGQRLEQHIRRAGEDLQAGKPALSAGKQLRPAELGIIASLGLAEVSLRRRVRVALFSTGDELCSVGTPLLSGAVYDSNRYTLWGMLTRLGCDVIDMGVVRDDPAALEAAFREAAGCADAIITSGGVSVGEADFIKQLMAQLGEVAFWKIAMKPGRPMAFGRIQPGGENDAGAWLFGLPGNPVAVMVTFYQFVRPAILKLAGVNPVPPFPSFPARCVDAMKKGRGRTEFQRGVLFQENGEWCVRPTGTQGSGILSSMARADCFIVLEPEREKVGAGETVQVQLMSGLV